MAASVAYTYYVLVRTALAGHEPRGRKQGPDFLDRASALLTQQDFFYGSASGDRWRMEDGDCGTAARHNAPQPPLSPSKMKLAIGSLLVAGAAAFAPASTSRVSSSALNLAVGEVAPDFALVDQNGKTVKRSSFKKPLVVYFYPADSTPGCTVQATEFNEQIKDIRKTYGAGE